MSTVGWLVGQLDQMHPTMSYALFLSFELI